MLIKCLVLFSVYCFFKHNDLFNALDLPLAPGSGCQGLPTFHDILSPSQSSGPLSEQPPTPHGAPGSAQFLATLRGGWRPCPAVIPGRVQLITSAKNPFGALLFIHSFGASYLQAEGSARPRPCLWESRGGDPAWRGLREGEAGGPARGRGEGEGGPAPAHAHLRVLAPHVPAHGGPGGHLGPTQLTALRLHLVVGELHMLLQHVLGDVLLVAYGACPLLAHCPRARGGRDRSGW